MGSMEQRIEAGEGGPLVIYRKGDLLASWPKGELGAINPFGLCPDFESRRAANCEDGDIYGRHRWKVIEAD